MYVYIDCSRIVAGRQLLEMTHIDIASVCSVVCQNACVRVCTVWSVKYRDVSSEVRYSHQPSLLSDAAEVVKNSVFNGEIISTVSIFIERIIILVDLSLLNWYCFTDFFTWRIFKSVCVLPWYARFNKKNWMVGIILQSVYCCLIVST